MAYYFCGERVTSCIETKNTRLCILEYMFIRVHTKETQNVIGWKRSQVEQDYIEYVIMALIKRKMEMS